MSFKKSIGRNEYLTLKIISKLIFILRSNYYYLLHWKTLSPFLYLSFPLLSSRITATNN